MIAQLRKISAILLLFANLHPMDAVTYSRGAGRFGDHLIAYMHAKWISFREGVPLLYHPFPHSEGLILSQEEMHVAEGAHFFHPSQIFVCPYFPESDYELQSDEWKDAYFSVDFGNEEFSWMLKKMIAPLKPLHCIHPPADQVSIAIHVREGGGYDSPHLSLDFPYKSPPVCFYSTCLNKVFEILGERPVFCFVFTDAKDPAAIVERLKQDLPARYPISFHYRESNNSYTNNVLEDFFSFQNFSILIRPDSNFSIVPCLLHSFAIVCSPLTFWFDEEGYPHTQELKMKIHPSLLQKIKEL
jgi:hypothetical protein